ncbi:hypothetical protein BH23CHL4_BH23CHL4_03330 [soil metagenome]
MKEVKDELLTIELEFWAAPPDASLYQEAFEESGLMVLPMESGILDKSQVIDSVRISNAWTSYNLIHERILELTDDCVALIYEARAERMGQHLYRAQITSIYRKQGDRWVMVLHQQTPITT